MSEKVKVPLYKRTWFIILTLIIFFPVGLILMWLTPKWGKTPKWIVTAVFAFLTVAAALGDEPEPTEEVAEADTEEETTEEVTEEETEEPTEEQTEEPTQEETTEEVTEESTEEETTEEPTEEATEEQTEEVTEEESTEEPTEETVEEPTEEKSTGDTELDNSTAEEHVLENLEESMGEFVSVEFDEEEKTYKMTPTDQELIDEIEMITYGVGLDSWNTLVEGITELSKSSKNVLGEGYTMHLVNPHNEDNALISVVDGVVMYNAADDL